MTENKQVQIIIHYHTRRKKAIITQRQKDKGISVNEIYQKNHLKTISEDINDHISDNKK